MARPQPTLRGRALRLLARREHSREELRRKLAAQPAEGDRDGDGKGEEIEALLDDLTARGWLSDARCAEQSIRAGARRYGPLRLAQRLRERGIDEEAIAAAFRCAADERIDGPAGDAGHDAGGGGADVPGDDACLERGLAKIWGSRFDAPPASERERARQVRFLQRRGFPLEAVLRFLRRPGGSGAR
jgi:regulatory protein